MFKAIADGFNYLFKLFIDLMLWMLNGIWKLLQPIFDLIGMIFEFVYWIGVIAVLVVKLVFGVGKLLIGLVVGLFKTIFGLAYTGGGPSLPGSYSSVYAHLQPSLDRLQLDKIAYVLQFGIWIATAYLALRIIGRMGASE